MPNIKQVSGGGNVTYYINEEAGVVVAKINAEEYEPFNVAESVITKLRKADEHNAPYDVFYCGGHGLMLDKSYVGVARCSPEDKFDLETGKRIALARAQVKYHTALHDSLYEIAMYFMEIGASINRRSYFEAEQAVKYNKVANAVQG